MDQYQETFKTWDKIATLYEDKFMNLDLYDRSYDLFCEALSKQNPKILEIGCGPGNITQYLLKKRPDLVIDAIDIAPNMIALAKANNPSANFMVMDSRNINQLNTKYDGIICGFCVPYLSDSDVSKLILDCRNLLSAHGILYMSFVEGDYAQSGFMAGSSGDRTYFYYHPWKGFNEKLQDNHFETTQLLHVEYDKADKTKETHTIALAKKTG